MLVMMPKIMLSIAYCLFTLCGIVLTSPPDTLKLVNVLYRHGDRSPTVVYPKDNNQASNTWPDGLGWLTNLGKFQQYELGQYIKQHYDGFLNTSYYDHNEIQIQSSSVERCLMSAYSHLAGLYTPQGSQIWNPDLLWQPIPVKTSLAKTDNKLALDAPCPRYDQLTAEVMASPEIQKEELENKAFYDMVENNTGINKESIKDIWAVGDTLFCELSHNLTWNAWVTPEVWTKMNKLRTYSFDLLTYNTEMTKLKGGPLLNEIIDNMLSATKTDVPNPKFYMYSAHDTTVAALLSAMHVFDSHSPIYRALVMVELHKVQDDYIVKIFYKNETTREPYELNVPGCPKLCKLSDFILLTKDTVPQNWEAECKLKNFSTFNSALTPASWIALSIGICMCVIISIALIVLIVRLKRKRDANYTKL